MQNKLSFYSRLKHKKTKHCCREVRTQFKPNVEIHKPLNLLSAGPLNRLQNGTGGVILVFVEVKEMPAEVPRGSSAGVFMLQSSLRVILRDQSCTMIISVSLGSDPAERLRSLTFLQDIFCCLLDKGSNHFLCVVSTNETCLKLTQRARRKGSFV